MKVGEDEKDLDLAQDAFYQTHILGKFPEPTPAERRAYELATEYHIRCETFDRSVCTGSKDGIAIPMNATETAAIEKHARDLLDSFYQELQNLGVSRADWHRALREWSWETYRPLPDYSRGRR